LNYIRKTTSSLEPLMEIDANSTEMIPGPLPKLLKWLLERMFKLCPWYEMGPCLGAYLSYIGIS